MAMWRGQWLGNLEEERWLAAPGDLMETYRTDRGHRGRGERRGIYAKFI